MISQNLQRKEALVLYLGTDLWVLLLVCYVKHRFNKDILMKDLWNLFLETKLFC
jgi:hypothetical protein